MRFLIALVGFFLVISLCNAAIVQRRIYRNTEEILVPVAIIQDGEEIKEPADLKENVNEPQIKKLEPELIAEDIAKTIAEDQKFEAVEAAVQAERRIDEAVDEEEIKEAIQDEQNKEITQEEESKLGTTLAEVPQIVTAIESENADAIKEPAQEVNENEKAANYKSVVVKAEAPSQVIVTVEANNESTVDEAQQPEGSIRQATQPTPTQSTTQQNFVQQLIQNSPLGQFFNQITGQTTLVASDDSVPAPAPTIPGLFNPVTAVQTAAQSVVNSTTQAFQGLQQFASNLGNQFQSTLSGLGGQQQDQASAGATTARPAGPIQQLVNTIIGTPQPSPTQQGPLQGFLNIFQGNNRPQGAAVNTNAEPQPAKEPESQQQNTEGTTASATNVISDQASNEVRDSGEATDSFEESVQPSELIVVSDDISQTENDQEQEVANVQYK